MGVFDDQIATALALITENGELSTIEREARTPGAKSWRPGSTTTSFTARAVWLNYNLRRVDGERIKAGDQKVLIAASGLSITPDASTDKIVRADGQRWSIENVETLAPNGELILYTLQVRV